MAVLKMVGCLSAFYHLALIWLYVLHLGLKNYNDFLKKTGMCSRTQQNLSTMSSMNATYFDPYGPSARI